MASAISFDTNNSGLQAGTINGAVNTNFHHHAPPERLETPPNPSIVIPFSRDKDFVERGTILDLIYEKFTGPGSRAALVGLGGAGKSQLAIEYAYQARDQSQETWVFWVHASNAARFEQSFRDIANCGKWILMLDNVDDASFLVQAQSVGRDGQRNDHIDNSRPLITYLPQCQNGSVLFTTRSKSAALKLVEQRDIIAVEPMGMADALALFEKKLGQCDDGNNTAELVEALEFMPLAIVQAASYILQRIPRYSLHDYLEDFRKNDRKRTNLLHHNGEQFRRDWEANNSILVTWQISFNYIRQTRSSAADLLFLEQNQESDGDNDDSSVSTAESDDDKDNSLGSSINDGFEDDILVLRDYSFINVNADRTTFEMHRLVQLATRKWLEDQKQQEKRKRQFIKKSRRRASNRRSAISHKPEEQTSLVECASILYKASWYAWEMGNGKDAENLSVKAMKVRKEILGREHEDTLAMVETSKEKLGMNHPFTLNILAKLASAYRNQGQFDMAERIFVEVMEINKKKFGSHHPDTLISMVNLASTYRNQERWDAAEELFVEVMEISKRKLGMSHPNTLININNLAFLYRSKGQLNTAEELEVQVMETRKKKSGVDHPDTLTSMADLAYTWKRQDKHEEALELRRNV
ncbi:uncharacterized protein EAE97_006336 [Botrytis byssoidea]|uniref:NB-ARC domain-containing protein n=1 Tax=Botrytis byssoidea TaxID=139641 RepID=A0A9P5IJ14_9HELO|nr:uncharacterized protein EAE97_006336 [Botrytis byssoidea]KAF7942882.1 hypothetical protein EAE97_006336 [Botrytis byssoidea]